MPRSVRSAALPFPVAARSPSSAQPSGGKTNQQKWLTILVQHVAAPRPSPQPNGRLQKLEAWIERAMEIEGEQEIQTSQAQIAASQALYQGLRDNV
jgi:hypothetical protein